MATRKEKARNSPAQERKSLGANGLTERAEATPTRKTWSGREKTDGCSLKGESVLPNIQCTGWSSPIVKTPPTSVREGKKAQLSCDRNKKKTIEK